MTTMICECGTTWTEGPTRDINMKEVCRHCLKGTISHLESTITTIKAELLVYGSEQFGLGRIEGQADAQAVAQIIKASSRPDPLTLRLD